MTVTNHEYAKQYRALANEMQRAAGEEYVRYFDYMRSYNAMNADDMPDIREMYQYIAGDARRAAEAYMAQYIEAEGAAKYYEELVSSESEGKEA